MNKKYICGILSTALLIGSCPVSAIAKEDIPVYTMKESIDLREKKEDCEGFGWKWDADSLTLTLEDFHYIVPYDQLEEKAAIYLPDESELEIEGDDNVLETYSYHCDAIYCEGELLVTGDGKLKIITDSLSASAFYLDNGRITFDDEVEVTIEPDGGYLIYVNYAKGRRPIISIQDKAKIIFNGTECKDRNILVTHKSSVKPADNWLDYAEVEDKWDDELINLVAKSTVVKEEPEKEPEATENVPETNEYKITIGDANIMKNGELSYTADVVPYLKNGYTMLPLRALLEVSNPDQKVNWNNGTKSAHTFVDNKLVSIKPGEATYTKVTETIDLHTPAETVNGRLFVSLRDWMDIMEIDVSQLDWDAETKTVTLKY